MRRMQRSRSRSRCTALAVAGVLVGASASCRTTAPQASVHTGQPRLPGLPARTAGTAESDPAATGAPSPDGAAGLQAYEYRFDRLKLGDLFATAALSRPPYDHPCDEDLVDHGTRLAVIYGGRTCRGATFPEGTSVLFLLPSAAAKDEHLHQPILVFGFLGGTYFHHRTSFPLRAGDPAARTRLLGPLEATITFSGYQTTLRAERHAGDVYALLDGDRVVGGLLGAMPPEPENEQWDVVLQVYERYTKPK